MDGASQAQGMESICVYCKKVVSEAMRIQIKRRQEDAQSFYKIHQQQFQRQAVIESMNRSQPRLPPPKVSAPQPKASLETQQVVRINGKWQLVYKTPPKPEPAAAVVTASTAERQADKRSRSSSSSSTSRRARKKRKKHKKRKKRSSSSSSSRHSAQPAAAASGGNNAEAELNRLLSLQKTEPKVDARQRQIDEETEKTKKELLTKLAELKKIESKDQRIKEFRALLRAWHPDKNPDKVEVATFVFQFLQKSKPLLD